jgi:hypothetical protein
MAIVIKPGVRILGLRPELLLGVHIVDAIFAKHGLDCVITSVIDGKHSRASLHYTGCGIDFRTRHIKIAGVTEEIRIEAKAALGDDFDFIFEGNHFHMEYQPKNGY